MKTQIKQGFKDSLPIIAGYFSVSFTFGIMVSSFGMSPFVAAFICLTNVTSAGQFAGLALIYAHAGFLELILTQIVINLRYALMSLALTQKIDPKVSAPKKMAIAFGVTDEIFAVSVSKPGKVGAPYMFGLIVGPVIAWTLGGFFGAFANELLPESVQSALGVALYGMFIAIVMPKVRREKATAIVVVISLLLSCIMTYAPVLNQISQGFAIIICTLVAAGLGAFFFPIKEEDGANTVKEDMS